MNLREMQEKRQTLFNEARDRLDQINANTDGSRAAELESAHDAAMAELDKIDAKIERERKMADAESRMEEAREALIRSKRPPFASAETSATGAEVSYRDAFHAYVLAGGKIESLSGEARSLMAAAETRAQTTTTNAAGGFTVPTELAAQLVARMKYAGPMYDASIVGEIVTPSGNPFVYPTTDDTGNTMVSGTQGTAFTDDGSADMTFGQKALGAYSFNTKWLNVSRELLSDSVLQVETIIADMLGQRLGRGANVYLTTGTGSNQPMGIVTAAPTTAQATAAGSGPVLSWDDVLQLIYSVDIAYRSSPKARLMFNDNTMRNLRKLKDSNGRYIFDLGNVREDVSPTIYGYNYSVNPQMADPALTAKPILFGDLSKFIVRKVAAPEVGVIQDKTSYPGISMAGYIRFDSQLIDTNAVKVLVMNAT